VELTIMDTKFTTFAFTYNCFKTSIEFNIKIAKLAKLDFFTLYGTRRFIIEFTTACPSSKLSQ
jgi:hypothetical protein